MSDSLYSKLINDMKENSTFDKNFAGEHDKGTVERTLPDDLTKPQLESAINYITTYADAAYEVFGTQSKEMFDENPEVDNLSMGYSLGKGMNHEMLATRIEDKMDVASCFTVTTPKAKELNERFAAVSLKLQEEDEDDMMAA